MKVLLHPTFFPSIASFVAMCKADHVIFEIQDNYQKQTYRNRTYIFGANGKLQLNVPVNYTQKKRQKYKDVNIANESKWQSQNWKSIESAYRTSPYFEFYEDELTPLFNSTEENLLSYNFRCLNVILECLQLDLNYSKTSVYESDPETNKDLRELVNVRKEKTQLFKPYIQVFSSKYGFINNLGILDLLFNEGPNALHYLESQKLQF